MDDAALHRPFLARAPEVVLDALEIEPKRTKAKPPTLASIAEKRGEPLPELERRIEEAIAGFRERQP